MVISRGWFCTHEPCSQVGVTLGQTWLLRIGVVVAVAVYFVWQWLKPPWVPPAFAATN
jgi:hypothetical protein